MVKVTKSQGQGKKSQGYLNSEKHRKCILLRYLEKVINFKVKVTWVLKE